MEPTEAKLQARAFLKERKSGVLSTLSSGGTPRARLVYYSSDDAFNIYFLTFLNTRKAEDLKQNAKVAFTVFDEHLPRTLQLEGDAHDITNSPVDDAIIEELFDRLQMNEKYYAPIARFDRSDVRFFRITPTWVRFGDFTKGHSTAEVLTEIEP